MAYERKTIDICQTCHEDVRGDQYFPDAERVGVCDRCGAESVLIARVRRDECDFSKDGFVSALIGERFDYP